MPTRRRLSMPLLYMRPVVCWGPCRASLHSVLHMLSSRLASRNQDRKRYWKQRCCYFKYSLPFSVGERQCTISLCVTVVSRRASQIIVDANKKKTFVPLLYMRPVVCQRSKCITVVSRFAHQVLVDDNKKKTFCAAALHAASCLEANMRCVTSFCATYAAASCPEAIMRCVTPFCAAYAVVSTCF